MAKEIFSIAAVFWILIPIGLIGGALLLKFQGDWFSRIHHNLSYGQKVKQILNMKILLVGATGTLGRQIAKQAIEDGHEVRCFVRNPRKASFLQEWGCELTKGNLLNSSDIEYALQDIEELLMQRPAGQMILKVFMK